MTMDSMIVSLGIVVFSHHIGFIFLDCLVFADVLFIDLLSGSCWCCSDMLFVFVLWNDWLTHCPSVLSFLFV